MSDTHTAAHIPDEAVQAAEAQFTEYFLKNYPKDCIIYNPAWHAPKIFRAAKAAIIENLPHLSAPCAVEVPEGWQLVPKDPTFEMAKAAIDLDPKSDLDAKYKAMLSAAPQVVTEPVDVAAVREECAEVVENAVLSYHVADCAGLADWKAFEKGQESGLKFGAAAIRALSPNEPAGRATLAQGGQNNG